MPKTKIDYSNTVIYKITCKDPLITDLYVGHTTNFVQRKHGHKQSCINEKSGNYNCKLYKTIRSNGGWDNWIMEIVAFFKCNDHYEARIKEQEYFTSLNATLNSLEPLPKPKPKPIETPQLTKEIIKKIYFCETCNITLQNQHLLEVHNQTKKHCKKVMGIETKNVANKFFCETCDYTCSKKYNLERHLTSSKHSKMAIGEQNDEQNEQNEEQHPTNKNKLNNDKFLCQICNKIYDSRNGLWKHKKKGCNKTCEQEIETNKITNQLKCDFDITDKELILMLVKQNAELIKETTDFKTMMMEVIKNGNGNNSQHH